MSARITLYLTMNLSVRLTYSVKGSLSYNSSNLIYIISCKNRWDQHVGSATDFKARVRIHKSDIQMKKDRCGTARHFKNKSSYTSPSTINLIFAKWY